MARVPLCPVHAEPMTLAIGGFKLQEWWCDPCGENRTVRLDPKADAPPTAVLPDQLLWMDVDVHPLFGRITTEEGG